MHYDADGPSSLAFLSKGNAVERAAPSVKNCLGEEVPLRGNISRQTLASCTFDASNTLPTTPASAATLARHLTFGMQELIFFDFVRVIFNDPQTF
jgi:hypothetical protein